MQIGKRLATIADMVPEGSILADIGTDHAYLPVWLLERGLIRRAIVSDIAKGPCQAARGTVAIHHLEGLVDIRLGNGLSVLRPNEVDCIVIAGMGGNNIISILQSDMERACQANLLILQPMSDASRVRYWLCSNGWVLEEEKLVDDTPYLYEIISAVRGESPFFTEAEYIVGPLLLRNRHPFLAKQFELLLLHYEKLLEGMNRSVKARESTKFKKISSLKTALEVLKNEYISNSK